MRVIVSLAVLAVLTVAPAARADGDPASDYLLVQSTFIPPDPYVPPPYANQLAATVRDARAHGYTIRVAVIGKRYAMGSVGVLWNQPEPYARFLGQELAFQYRKNLLVVMPNGFGVSRGGKASPAQQSVVDRLGPPGRLSIGLVSAATKAVARLAQHAGADVRPARLNLGTSQASNVGRTTRSGFRIPWFSIALLAVGGLLVVGLLRLLRRPPAR